MGNFGQRNGSLCATRALSLSFSLFSHCNKTLAAHASLHGRISSLGIPVYHKQNSSKCHCLYPSYRYIPAFQKHYYAHSNRKLKSNPTSELDTNAVLIEPAPVCAVELADGLPAVPEVVPKPPTAVAPLGVAPGTMVVAWTTLVVAPPPV